jgi:hypothetical protein
MKDAHKFWILLALLIASLALLISLQLGTNTPSLFQ